MGKLIKSVKKLAPKQKKLLIRSVSVIGKVYQNSIKNIKLQNFKKDMMSFC